MSLPRLSIRRPVALTMFYLGVVLLGVLSFVRLPIDLLPDVAYPQLVIQTTNSGAAPAEVERFVTEPIEQAVGTVPGVQTVESVSREGSSLVTVRFAWGTDMDFAALNVREKLDNLGDALPELSERPVILRTDPRSEPVMALSIAGANLPAVADLAQSVFKRRLEQIDGVARAAVTGAPEREIRVEVDPHRLEALSLTLQDVAAALDAANASASGGTIRRGRYRYALRTLGEFQSVAEIGAVPIRSSAHPGRGERSQITLRDVAQIEDGFRERESLARFNGETAVGLLVFKSAGANTVQVAERVREVLDQLRTEYPDVRVEVAMSQARFISAALSNVVQEVIAGGILAFLVLFFFLRDWRYPIAVALAIPLSLIATFALLELAGVTLNIMSLGGLALGVGMLMDNSIVVLENIFRHREKGLAHAAAAAVGAEEVQRAIAASTLTTIAVFGPIVYVEGVAGQLLKPLALAVAFSLLASVLVAITLLPMLAARWEVGSTTGEKEAKHRFWLFDAFDRAWARFAATYERLLVLGLDHRGWVMALAAALLVLGVCVGLTLRRSVLPAVDQGAFRARIELPRGTPLERTAEMASRLEDIFRADRGVDAVFTRVGRQAAVAGMDLGESGLNTAVLEVRLRDGAATNRVLARMRPELTAFGGAVTLESGEATALGQLLGGGEADLSVRVRGNDTEAALAYASEVKARLDSLPALTNVRLGTEMGQPEIRIEIDRERAAAYGIAPEEIADAVESAMRGTIATRFVDFDRKVPIVVRLHEAERRSLGTLDELRVDGVPLRELVRLDTDVGPAEIRRMDQSRVVPVFADVAAGGLNHAVAAVHTALATLPPPHGLRVEVGGENEEMRQGFRALGFAFLLALLLVYMLLAAEFESLLHPFIILLAVPLAAVGATLTLAVAGSGLNVMSLIGMVILVGIVDNDAVVKVDFINQMRREGMARREAIFAAGHARLRPIVMNTLTAILGLLPMALGIGAGAELQAPLAIAVLGGLFSATLLTLIVIPVSYDLLEALRDRTRVWMAAGTARPAATAEPSPTSGLIAGD